MCVCVCVCVSVCVCVCYGTYLIDYNELSLLLWIPGEYLSRSEANSSLREAKVATEAIFASPLQLLGCIWRAMFASAQIWPGVSRHWRFPSVSGDHPPGFYYLTGGGVLPDTWGAPIEGNVDGTEGIFGNAGRVWATALRPDPP